VAHSKDRVLYTRKNTPSHPADSQTTAGEIHNVHRSYMDGTRMRDGFMRTFIEEVGEWDPDENVEKKDREAKKQAAEEGTCAPTMSIICGDILLWIMMRPLASSYGLIVSPLRRAVAEKVPLPSISTKTKLTPHPPFRS
jgi:hypothetical protein